MTDPNQLTEHKLVQLAKILNLLADGDYHSGSKIAQYLDVSRAYVWKLIKELEHYGIELSSSSGKGYCWQASSQLLDSQQLSATLADTGITYFLITDSTNQQLKQNFLPNQLIVTEYQTEGRGRRGRSWQSPMAANIYASYGWKTELPIQQLGGLSLVAGMAMIAALQQEGFTGLQLKWPNDIRYQGKKLGGILIELSGDAIGGLEVIIGFGLNVNMQSSNELSQAIEQDWTSLCQLNQQKTEQQESSQQSCDRQSLLVVIVKSLKNYLERFAEKGFEDFLQEWRKVDESLNRKIQLLQNNSSLTGIARGVDASGALLLEINNEMTSCYAGEVTLRYET